MARGRAGRGLVILGLAGVIGGNGISVSPMFWMIGVPLSLLGTVLFAAGLLGQPALGTAMAPRAGAALMVLAAVITQAGAWAAVCLGAAWFLALGRDQPPPPIGLADALPLALGLLGAAAVAGGRRLRGGTGAHWPGRLLELAVATTPVLAVVAQGLAVLLGLPLSA